MKKIIGTLILLTVFGWLIYNIYDIYQETKIKDYSEKTVEENQQAQENIVIEETKVEENVNLNLVPNEYKGYIVSAKLKIEKLDIDTCVLDDCSESAMEVAVAKYFGPEPNEVGNYCIAGHNYITKNMFSELRKLEIGDTFTLTDNKHGEIEYVIFDKYKVSPDQTQSLSQKTNGEKQVTLITCSDYSAKRIIIKATENNGTSGER